VSKSQNDNRLCQQILDCDSSIRVAAFIEGAEVSGYAGSPRITNMLNQSDLREKIGVWARLVTEISRETDQLFGSTEYICLAHKGLKMITVPLSANRSLGLSVERSADLDYLLMKIMVKFDLKSAA
jgi:hypothetical protein